MRKECYQLNKLCNDFEISKMISPWFYVPIDNDCFGSKNQVLCINLCVHIHCYNGRTVQCNFHGDAKDCGYHVRYFHKQQVVFQNLSFTYSKQKHLVIISSRTTQLNWQRQLLETHHIHNLYEILSGIITFGHFIQITYDVDIIHLPIQERNIIQREHLDLIAKHFERNKRLW